MNDHTNLNAPIRSPIQILSPLVANQISAGEIVERPASVLKELLENSVDAKATRIDIELFNGGLSLIRVTDDGIGIAKEELALSLSRHATSKIQTIEDLEQITTLGFRGEALASIASVSKLRLTSKVKEEEAYQCRVSYEGEPEILPGVHKNGTTVEVQDLFYNVPVRRKFLKSIKTEFERIDEIFKKMALSHYNIHFTLIHNQKKLRDYPKALTSMARLMRVQKIMGKSFVESAYQVDFEQNGLKLSGYIGAITSAGRHTDCQYFFVNQRMIRDKVVSHAIKTAFQTGALLLEGLHPAYVLYLKLDPKEVDVNVHPTKYEVRFCYARMIHDFITQSLLAVFKHTVSQKAPITLTSLPLTLDKESHFQSRYDGAKPSPQVHNRWLLVGHYYVLSLQEGLMLIDRRKVKALTLKNPDLDAIAPLRFPLSLTEDELPTSDRVLLETIGFCFSQNIKQEWVLRAIPKAHDCLVRITLEEIGNLFK